MIIDRRLRQFNKPWQILANKHDYIKDPKKTKVTGLLFIGVTKKGLFLFDPNEAPFKEKYLFDRFALPRITCMWLSRLVNGVIEEMKETNVIDTND